MFDVPRPRRRVIAAIVSVVSLFSTLDPQPARSGDRTWTGTAPRAKSIEAIARDPLDANRIWAASFGSGVHRTINGGAGWTSYRTGLVNTFVRSLAVEPNHPDSVFCGTNDGVALSVDGGLTWKSILSTTSSVRALAIHPIRTGTIYAGTYGNGVYKSVNAGKNWAQVNLGLVNTNVRDIALNPARPDTILLATGTGGGVHRSFNGGLTWAQVPDTAATHGAAEQIQWDPQNTLRAYVAELDRGVLRTTDGGDTWLRINRGLTSLRSRSLAVVDTLRYLGTDGAGVFFTTLSDTMWHPMNTGITSLLVNALSPSAAAPGACLAGTDGGGIFSTSNRGASWSQWDGGLLNTFGFSLAIRPTTHSVYAGLGFGDQFWASADQGATWTRTLTLTSHDSEHGVLPDPVDGNRVYLSAYGSGVYRSDDDGATWTRPDISVSLTNSFVRDLVAWPGQTGHLFVGTGDGVFESSDGATTWSSRRGDLPAMTSVRSLALVPGSPATLLIGSDTTGVWRSTDDGVHWTAQNAGLPVMPARFIHALLVDAQNPLVVYAGTDSGVFKSVNGAGTWAAARTGLPAGDVVALAQDQTRPQVLFCAISLAGVFESLDGGAQWSALLGQVGLADLHVRSLAVDGALSTIYVGSDDGVATLSNYPTATTAIPPVAGILPGLRAWPNPLGSGALRIDLATTRPGRVSAAFFGVTGQRVRSIADGREPAGEHAWAWDGTDERGNRVAPGIYFLHVASPDGVSTRRIVVLDR